MKEIEKKEFSESIAKGYALVDFFATWCGPCKMLTPVLEELSNEEKEVAFYKIDVDKSQELSQKYSVSSVPTVCLFHDGKEIGRFSGYLPKEQVVEFIKSKQN